jgi:hypothetical protein
MGLESSAINDMVDDAASAKALWSADRPAPAPSQQAIPASRPRPSSRREATQLIRSKTPRVSPRQLACFVGIAMITMAVGLSLRGTETPMVGTAAAAAPALTVTPLSTITVTPIELPAETPTVPTVMPTVPTVPTVMPIEQPTIVAEDAIAIEDEPAPKTFHRTKTRTANRKKSTAALRIAAKEVEAPRHDKAHEKSSSRRAQIDVSNCVDTALGCLKMGNPAAAAKQANAENKKSNARKAKPSRKSKRFRGMTSADEDW